MKRLFFLTILALLFSIFIFTPVRAELIVGEVTIIGDGAFKLREDRTQVEYQLLASAANLARVRTGHRVVVNASNGRVSSLTILGMPMVSQPEPFQKFTITTYPEE